MHLDTNGLTVAAFLQTTSRLDDPQLHTHLVISGKVQTADGRWLALDARVLKQHQRAFGGLYQSVLRAELAHRFGVGLEAIVNGQAEIAGVPEGLLEVFSKRAVEVRDALDVKLSEFHAREGRDPSTFERAAMEREAAADTRQHKTGVDVTDLRARWLAEAADLGITPETFLAAILQAGRASIEPPAMVSVDEVLHGLAERRSVWHRLDVLREITDRQQPTRDMTGEQWALHLDRVVDRVLDESIDLDPTDSDGRVRRSDGRSVWIEPVAPRVTSRLVLEQELAIIDWATAAQRERPQPSTTIKHDGLDVLQAEAAAAVAGRDRLVVIVGPAGAGKTTMLRAAVDDLREHGRVVFGVAPTAKAARVLEDETGMRSDTLAKLLHEWQRPDGPRPDWRLDLGTTVVVDEAGMASTTDLHHFIGLADRQRWQLALVGDPSQLQAVGRGGMFAEICDSACTIKLEQIHRFTNAWEAAASLQLRAGDTTVLDTYEAHDRIRPGSLTEHLDHIADAWIARTAAGETLAITTTRNDHVDLINKVIQRARLDGGDLDSNPEVAIAINTDVTPAVAYVGDVIATRHNQRDLVATDGQPVRNRDLWTITAITDGGGISVQCAGSDATVQLPAGYVREYVRLGYAATEPGNQADTRTASITLATSATIGRGLYVGMTRGRQENLVLAVTATHDHAEARDILESIIAVDRADAPAIAHQRNLNTATPSAPELTPRCAIPNWFAELHDAATAAFEAAQRDHDSVVTSRKQIAAATELATQRLTAANLACRPFDEQLAIAKAALAAAIGDRCSAEHRLDQSGIVGRRNARHELTDATDTESATQSAYDAAVANGQRVWSERSAARDELIELRDRRRREELMNAWTYLPERAADTQDHLAALDTWQLWATGQPVPSDQLRAAAVTLAHASRPSLDGHALYDALRRTLHEHIGPIPEHTDLEHIGRSPRTCGLGR